MRNKDNLKKELLKLKECEWKIPDETNKYELALDMLKNIDSTDPVLRDELILELLWIMIIEGYLTDDETREILKLTLSEEHLFNGIGAIGDDSVFNRAFTILVIGCILYRHNNTGSKLLKREELIHVYKEVIRYTMEEKDVRGYDEEKGWAHSAAHTSDAICELSKCIELDEEDLLELLKVLKNKLLINYYTYVNFEEERMLTAVMSILERGLISNDDVIKWIKSFENIELLGVGQIDMRIRVNRKNFLTSMYFRLKRRNIDKDIIDELEAVIDNTTLKYFK